MIGRVDKHKFIIKLNQIQLILIQFSLFLQKIATCDIIEYLKPKNIMTYINASKLIIFTFFLIGIVSCGGESSTANKTEAKVASSTTPTSQTTTSPTKSSTSKKVIISGEDMTVKSGEEFCLDVQVTNFIDVVSMQYSTNFDSKMLEYVEVKNPSLKDLSMKPGVNFARTPNEENTLRFTWFVQDLQGISLYDGSTIYQVCFKAIGKSGTQTEVDFAEKPMEGEVGVKSGKNFVPAQAEFGEIKITIE